MKCPNRLYRWIDRRGRIPRWVKWIWKWAHWCPEMDELLVVDNVGDCFCEVCGDYRRKFWDALEKTKLDDDDEVPF